MNIEEIQGQWQTQKIPKEVEIQTSGTHLLHQLYRLQRKTIFVNLMISVCFALVFIGLGLVWNKIIGKSYLYDVGSTIIFADMLLAMGFFWRMVISWKRNQFDLTSTDFLASVIQKLTYRKKVIRLVIPIYLIVLMIGLNLTYLYALRELALGTRILIHAVLSAGFILVIVVGAYFQKKRMDKHINPILVDLQETYQQLREGTVDS